MPPRKHAKNKKKVTARRALVLVALLAIIAIVVGVVVLAVNGIGKVVGNSENKTWGTRYTLNKADGCASEIVVNGGTFDGQSLRGSFEKEIHPLDENPKLLFLAPSLLINVSNIKILDTDNITFEDDTVLYFPKKGFPIVQARWKKYNEG